MKPASRFNATDAVMWPISKEAVELGHAIPVFDDMPRIDDAILTHEQLVQRTVITRPIHTIDSLFMNAADAWTKAAAQHRERRKIAFGVAMRIRVVFLEF